MKILHTADWHLGRRIEGRSRHGEQVAALDEICRIADQERVDAVLIAGDIFDNYNPPTESEALFYGTMTRLSDGGRRSVIVIAGNHDSPDRLLASDPYARSLGITTIGYPRDIPPLYDGGSTHVSTVESAPSFVRLLLPRRREILTVLALPYPSETRLKEVLTEEVDDEEQAMFDYNRRVGGFMQQIASRFVAGDANLIASHLFVNGGLESDSERPISVGGAYTVDPLSFPGVADYVALGHLHREQEKRGNRDIPIRYSGSILQYSFSESGQQKSVTVIELDRGALSYRIIPLGSGRPLERIVADGAEELERKLAAADPTAWLKVTFRVETALELEYMPRIRSAYPAIVDIYTEFTGAAFTESLPERLSDLRLDEQFRRFVGSTYGEIPDERVITLFMELTQGEEGETVE